MGEENKSISLNDIEYLNEQLEKFSKSKREYSNTIKKMLNLFENQEVVQSFLSSGKFGQQQIDKISEIYNLLKQYDKDYFSDNNSLVLKTKQVLTKTPGINAL